MRPARGEAERAGFEPAVRFDPHTAFPVPHNRPLCHLSEAKNAAKIGLFSHSSCKALAAAKDSAKEKSFARSGATCAGSFAKRPRFAEPFYPTRGELTIPPAP